MRLCNPNLNTDVRKKERKKKQGKTFWCEAILTISDHMDHGRYDRFYLDFVQKNMYFVDTLDYESAYLYRR